MTTEATIATTTTIATTREKKKTRGRSAVVKTEPVTEPAFLTSPEPDNLTSLDAPVVAPPTTTLTTTQEPKKPRSRKPSGKTTVPPPPPVQEEEEVVLTPEIALANPPDIPLTEAVAGEGEVPTTTIKNKRAISKQLIASEFEEVYKELEAVLGRGDKKLLRRTKQLKTNTFRALKVSTHERRIDPTVSGFMKPIHISADMASFINVNKDDMVRRVDVTKQLCDYIKRNNLQNPLNRREILPDGKLKTLLRISDNESEPLTYYNLQKRLKWHVRHPENGGIKI